MYRAIKWLLIVDVLVIFVSMAMGGLSWLINTQIAFLSSSMVLTASMISYRRMVQNRLDEGMAIPDDDRDTLDKIDDPHDLYSDDESVVDISVLKEAIKEEKDKLKKNRRSIAQVMKDSRASLSFFRLGAYALLFVGFLFLIKNTLLHMPSYLVSLSLPIAVMMAVLLTQKESAFEKNS